MSALMAHLFKGASLLRSKKCLQLWFGFFIYHFTIKGFLFQLTAVPSNKIMVWLGIYFISCFTQVSLSYICCKVFGISTCLRFIGNSELSHALITHSTWRWRLASCQRWITQLWITKCPKKVTHWTLKLHWGCCSACCCCCSKSMPPSLRVPRLSAAEEDRNYVDEKIMKYFFVTETFF